MFLYLETQDFKVAGQGDPCEDWPLRSDSRILLRVPLPGEVQPKNLIVGDPAVQWRRKSVEVASWHQEEMVLHQALGLVQGVTDVGVASEPQFVAVVRLGREY